MRTHIHISIGVALIVLFAVTAPRNHTEAEDAYSFAWSVERESGRELLHPHHLAYLPAMVSLHRMVTAVAGPVRAHPLMVGVSIVAAASAVTVFAWLLAGPFGCGRRRAWAAAAGLAASYGFLRYAAEAEIYAPMLLLVLGAWAVAARAGRPSGAVLSGMLGGVAMLVHVFAVIPVLAAIPLWLWMRRGLRPALSHGAVAAGLAAAAYACAGLSPLRTIGDAPPGDRLRREGGVSAASFARAGVGLGQALVSGNFLFAQPRFAATMQARYPARMLEEEVFMGRAARPWMRVVPWGTLLVLLAAAGVWGIAVVRGIARGRTGGAGEHRTSNIEHGTSNEGRTELNSQHPTSNSQQPTVDVQGLEDSGAGGSKGWKAAMAAGAVWFAAHAGLLVWKEPGNPELWIAALPALWIVVTAMAAAARAAIWPAIVLAATLAAHNWAGGLALLRDPAGDYNAAKAAAILAEARPGDTVVTAGGPVFFRHLRYHSPAQVVDAWTGAGRERVSSSGFGSPDTMRDRLWVLGDVFAPPPSLGARFPAEAEALGELSAWLRDRVTEVGTDGFGGVFRLRE